MSQVSQGGVWTPKTSFEFAEPRHLPAIEASSLPSPRQGRDSSYRGRDSDFAHTEVGTPTLFLHEKPSPGQRRRSGSESVLAAQLPECFFHHSHAQPSIARAQDCPTQSWRGRRIAPLNPRVGAGLPHSILAWAQDCPVFPRKRWKRSAVQRYAPRLARIAQKTTEALTENSGCESPPKFGK